MAKTKKQNNNFIFKICAIGFICIALVNLIDLQIQLSNKKQELNDISEQLYIANIENKELEMVLGKTTDESYIERVAQEELDFAYPDEKVYIDISGS